MRSASTPVPCVAACVAAVTLAGCGGGAALPRLPAAQPTALSGSCEALAPKLASLPNTVITATSTVAAGPVGGVQAAEHCLVSGDMHRRTSAIDGRDYAVAFQMRLPKNWNGRYYYQGNGGIDGSVVPAAGALGGGPLTGALAQGFAVMSSDAGHNNATSAGPAFGIDPQARLDYGYQASAKLLPTAREIIRVAYGKGPDRLYFGGCSNGGRHALVAAARYGDQYDGFLAGAPGYNLPLAAVANIAGGQRYLALSADPTLLTAANLGTAWTAPERALVSNAVLAQCDALDGVADGLVQDTAACQVKFRLADHVPTCANAAARDGTCLTAAQKTAIGEIFAGVQTRSGARVYNRFPFDSGHGAAGVANWEFDVPLTRDSGAVGLIFKVPPLSGASSPAQLATWAMGASVDSMMAEIHATNATYTESSMSFMTPPNPTQLSTVRDRGGKILVYHGVSDAIFSVQDTIDWMEGLQARYGGEAGDFVRLFNVPGMGHCSGGPATDQFDALTKLVAWVEQGEAPDRIVASARGPGNAGGANAELPAGWSASRTRPLCPYPKVARYVAGDVESEASFRCE